MAWRSPCSFSTISVILAETCETRPDFAVTATSRTSPGRALREAAVWRRTPQEPLGRRAKVLRSSCALPARYSSMLHSARGVPSRSLRMRTTVPDRL